MVLSCFDFRPPRNRIVLNELEFPSVRYVYQALRDSGAELVVVPSDDGIRVPTGRMIEAIDERTLLVPFSHVLYRSACIQDVAAITAGAHRMGAYVVLDTYHSAGVLPLDVQGLAVDFAVGGVLKWLCGGPGAAFLYVRPDLGAHLKPRLAGWQAHRRPFAFEGEMDLREDAWRFLTGTPQVPALYAARPGLEIINKVGVANIRAKSVCQTSLLVELARERGWRVNSPLDAAERRELRFAYRPSPAAVTGNRLGHEALDVGVLFSHAQNAAIAENHEGGVAVARSTAYIEPSFALVPAGP
jgi:kynureninase